MKRDGRYEPFDRRKLVLGFQKACEKRPVSPEVIEKAVDKIMEELEQKYGREIPTTAIPQLLGQRITAQYGIQILELSISEGKLVRKADRKLSALQAEINHLKQQLKQEV